MGKHVEDLLLPLLRDELGPAERRGVEDHVAACQTCRRSLRELDRLVADLRRSAPPVPPIHWSVYRAELREKLERRAARPESGRSWRFRPIPVALAAGLVAVLVYVGAPEFGRRGGPGSEDQVPENAILASQLDLISRLDLVQRLDLLEDFDVIRRLDGLERTREG